MTADSTATELERATVTHDEDGQRYVLHLDGEAVGELDYRERDGVLDLHHTEVDGRLEGRGLGTRLVADALVDVRARGLQVRPTCSFVRRYLHEHPDDADLVAPR